MKIFTVALLLTSLSAFAKPETCQQAVKETEARIQTLEKKISSVQAARMNGSETVVFSSYIIKEYTAEIQLLVGRRLTLISNFCN